MRNVILMGLHNNGNIGDLFIPKCVQHIVSNIDDQKLETRLVCLEPPHNNFRYLIYAGLKVISRILPPCDISYRIVYIANKIRVWQYYKKNIRCADAIIFTLGSFKYTTQDSWAHYVLVIQIAEKMHIPVMFNAMNIQNYNEKDWRCKILKKYANYSCVKMITTRDGNIGVDELKNNYITNPNTKIAPVGDPAYWIPECYHLKKSSGNKVGINLIRGNIFIYYGHKTTKEELLDFYAELIAELNRKNIEWELFTNGMQQDLKFGYELIDKLGMNNKLQIRVPKSDVELAQLIAGYKGIIGARLHSCICAYSLDIPTTGFIWDKKLLSFSQVTHLEKYFLSEQNLNAKLMVECLEDAMMSSYDSELRDSVKNATRESIHKFLLEAGDA